MSQSRLPSQDPSDLLPELARESKDLRCHRERKCCSDNGVSGDTPPVADPLIRCPGWALLEWDFLSTSRARKTEASEAPYGLGALAHQAESTASYSRLRLSGCPAGRWIHTDTCTLWLMETRQNILIGHKAKFSRHTVRREEPSFVLFYIGDPQQSQSEEICELTGL